MGWIVVAKDFNFKINTAKEMHTIRQTYREFWMYEVTIAGFP